MQASPEVTQRGLTLRSFVVCIFALLLMGMWIEYEELFLYYGGPLAENAPPNSAIGVIVILLIISALLYQFRKKLRLSTAELVVVLCALLVAAPLMTQGMWHRIFGLVAAIPHEQDFKSYQSLPPMLWPHGKNLVRDGRFTEKLGNTFTQSGGTLSWTLEEVSGRKWDSPVLTNVKPGDRATISFTISNPETGKKLLVPNESFLFSCLVKTQDFANGSSYFVTMRADNKAETNVLLNTNTTAPSLALPAGFERIGLCPLKIPEDLEHSLTFNIGVNGPGKLTVQDIQFFNSQAVEGLYSGVKIVSEKNQGKLKPYEQNFTIVKPDNMLSKAGVLYILRGFIPLEQWVLPALAWTVLIGALFMGFLGLNVIMRKQWLEHERLTLPMNILPRELFTEEADGTGRIILPIFRNKIMWIGFGITLILALMKGAHYYYPQIPAPLTDTEQLSTYFSNPLMRAYLTNVSITFCFTWLAIALFVETEILFSLWFMFLLFQVWFLCGKAFNFSSKPGYPWEFSQSIGAFIAYAFIAVYAGRRHLIQVWKHILGKKTLDDTQEVVSYRTAGLMVVGALVILALWGIWTKMGAWPSLLFFGYVLLCGFAASKIRAEAGPPNGYWMPYYSMAFVGAIGGFASFGSTGMLVAAIASGFIFVSCFLFVSPVQIEMMELGRRFNIRMKDIGYGLTLGLLGGLFIGGFVLLCWAYGFGADNLATSWPYAQHWYFRGGFQPGELTADRAFVSGTLVEPASLVLQPKKYLEAFPDMKGISIGAIITGFLALMRSLFMWFPLHPIGYILAPTYFGRGTWFVCLVAWIIRWIVQRIGGAHTIRKALVPFVVGMFLACIVSILIFDAVGFYLLAHGVTNIYSKVP
ncbi:MAG: DUF6785 family protein [Armatimonadota bacterium]